MLAIKRKTNLIFYQIVGIGLVFLAGLIFLGINLYPRLILVGGSLLDKLESICGCTNHWLFTSHPWFFSFIILASLAMVIFFCLAIIKILYLRNSTNRFIKSNLKNKRQKLSLKLKQVAAPLGFEDRIIEVNNKEPVVFCFGLIKPKICISRAFVKKLNKTELRSVLLHEQYHLFVGEPAKLFIVKAIIRMLFFVPGLKLLGEQYFTSSELAADKWAIDNSPDKSSLARAVYKVLQWKEKIIVRDNLAVPSFNNITEERIKRMVDDNYIFNIRNLTSKFLMLAVVIFLLLASFYAPVYFNQSAMASDNGGSCMMEYKDMDEQCQILLEDMECNMSYKTGGSVCSE